MGKLLDDKTLFALVTSLQNLQELIKCPLCFNTIKDPQGLTCGHIVCEGCLQPLRLRLHCPPRCPVCKIGRARKFCRYNHAENVIKAVTQLFGKFEDSVKCNVADISSLEALKTQLSPLASNGAKKEISGKLVYESEDEDDDAEEASSRKMYGFLEESMLTPEAIDYQILPPELTNTSISYKRKFITLTSLIEEESSTAKVPKLQVEEDNVPKEEMKVSSSTNVDKKEISELQVAEAPKDNLFDFRLMDHKMVPKEDWISDEIPPKDLQALQIAFDEMYVRSLKPTAPPTTGDFKYESSLYTPNTKSNFDFMERNVNTTTSPVARRPSRVLKPSWKVIEADNFKRERRSRKSVGATDNSKAMNEDHVRLAKAANKTARPKNLDRLLAQLIKKFDAISELTLEQASAPFKSAQQLPMLLPNLQGITPFMNHIKELVFNSTDQRNRSYKQDGLNNIGLKAAVDAATQTTDPRLSRKFRKTPKKQVENKAAKREELPSTEYPFIRNDVLLSSAVDGDDAGSLLMESPLNFVDFNEEEIRNFSLADDERQNFLEDLNVQFNEELKCPERENTLEELTRALSDHSIFDEPKFEDVAFWNILKLKRIFEKKNQSS